MAITGSFSTDTGVNFNLIAYYEYAQDTSANTSTVTVTLKLKHRTLYASALSGSYLSVAGNKITYSKSISYSGTSLTETTLATKTVTINHDTSGQGSCTIKADFVLNGTISSKYIGTLSLNQTLTLQTIPRASKLSVASSVNTGSSLTVTITPSSSSFKHKVRFTVDGAIKYTSDFIAAGTNSFSYQIPHSWSPDKTSKTMTVILYTYTSSGADVANMSTTTAINVPSSVIPTVSSLQDTPVDALDGNYVQGKSKVTITATAKPGDGSTLTHYYFEGANISGSGNSYTIASTSTSASQKSGVISSTNTQTYKVRVQDARGRYSEWKTINIVIQPYSAPKVSSITAQRCLKDGTLDNNGTYAKVTVKTSHASINGKNTANVLLSNSLDNYVESVKVIESANASNTYTGVYGGTFYELKSRVSRGPKQLLGRILSERY